MSDDFIRTIVTPLDSSFVDDDDEEVIQAKDEEINQSFSFAFTESERKGAIFPWDFSSAKRALKEDKGTSVDAKIKSRLASNKAKELEKTKKAKLAIKGEDDNDEEDNEEDEENADDADDMDDQNTESNAIAEPDDNEDDEDDEEEDEKPAKKSKKPNQDILKEVKSGRAPKLSTYFEAAPSSDDTISFEDLELAKPLLKAVTSLGYTHPTPIQARAIPVALSSKDIVGSAQTGSGKTAAFMLPILHKILMSDRRLPSIKCLVLTPTRELAVQCHSVTEKLARFTNIKSCLVIGGLSNASQEQALRLNPDVVVATPGRLIDHLRNAQSISMEELEFLVIDEADRLLEVGFIEAVEEIIRHCPKKRQSLLFSATMTESVDRLVKVSLYKPVRVSVDKTTDVASNLSQEFIKMKKEELREATLLALCSRTIKSNCLVFFQQKKEAHRAKILFGLAGLNAAELHGNMSQRARLEALESFRDGKTDYLLATDVAARGLDIMGIQTVMNFSMPTKMTTYIHRVGRTARAGENGLSISLAGENDRSLLKQIIKYAKSKVKQRIVPSDAIEEWQEKIKVMENDLKAIYKEENAERELRKTEMDATRIENMLLHEEEIKNRPRKTWFVSTRDKMKIKANAKDVAGEADFEHEGNDPRENKKRKRDREHREEIKQNIKEREKKKIQKDFANQKITAKAYKRDARDRKAGKQVGPKERPEAPKAKKSKPKSNFEDGDKPRMKDFAGKKAPKRGFKGKGQEKGKGKR